ncbi:hypothetical protein OU792_10180 [Algoriphagus sp. NF]|nr:hypothetical protein [Algoriphagus sp. NF]
MPSALLNGSFSEVIVFWARWVDAKAGQRSALSVEACLPQAGFFASKAFGYFWPSKVVKGKICIEVIKILRPFLLPPFVPAIGRQVITHGIYSRFYVLLLALSIRFHFEIKGQR